MVYKHRINNTEFIVHVHKNGGRTDVYRDKALYFTGQYFPTRKLLWTQPPKEGEGRRFGFEEVRKRIENSINTRIPPGDVTFPYYKS